METRFALGAAGGALTVREEGGRAVFEAVLPDDRRGLYKVWLTGRGGQFLLGTLMPENARLRLHRTLPVAELERHGVWPLTGAQARLAFPFGEGESTPPKGWRWEREPGRLLGDRQRGAAFCRFPVRGGKAPAAGRLPERVPAVGRHPHRLGVRPGRPVGFRRLGRLRPEHRPLSKRTEHRRRVRREPSDRPENRRFPAIRRGGRAGRADHGRKWIP